MSHRILVVDDDGGLRHTIAEALAQHDFDVLQAADGLEALALLEQQRCDFVMLDVNMPHLDGLECLRRIKALDSSIIVIIMTAYSKIEDAVSAIKEGAYNYLAKPIKHQEIVSMVKKALEAHQLVHNIALSRPTLEADNREFVGSSSEMQKVFAMVHKLTKVDTSVLIRGESGTGKELVARAIHFNSSRKDHRFVAINCSSIPENLFESDLFGHEKGAFTGASHRQIGKLQYADGGTVFLDEIGDLPLAMQVKLLRVLQERKFTPVGSNRELDMDVRILAATNRNLEQLIKEGGFREDLFYRLNVIPIYLPPLRQRKEDIERLITHFIGKFNQKHKKKILSVDTHALEALMAYQWPGNIRELENVIEHAFVIESSDAIGVGSLPENIRPIQEVQPAVKTTEGCTKEAPEEPFTDSQSLDFQDHKSKFEREFIIRALKAFNGRINQTAQHANIPKKTLLRKLQKYDIRPEDFKN